MAKPKVAFYWCASCGGCGEAVVDLAEDLLKVVEAVDIVFWPVAMDFKKEDVEAMGGTEIAVSFINGALGVGGGGKTPAEKIGIGGGLRLLRPPGRSPGAGQLPQPADHLRAGLPGGSLDQVVDEGYYLPGCAPPPDLILEAITAILEGNLPEKGAVLAPDKSLCDTCPLADSKPDKVSMKDIERHHEILADTEKCYLVQGLICHGPATRSGCGERCINADMPCREERGRAMA